MNNDRQVNDVRVELSTARTQSRVERNAGTKRIVENFKETNGPLTEKALVTAPSSRNVTSAFIVK